MHADGRVAELAEDMVDRCSLSWASGRGLLEVYWGWTDAASAGDQAVLF